MGQENDNCPCKKSKVYKKNVQTISNALKIKIDYLFNTRTSHVHVSRHKMITDVRINLANPNTLSTHKYRCKSNSNKHTDKDWENWKTQ